jgi:uncharacterized protein YceH (UPF0502 family)
MLVNCVSTKITDPRRWSRQAQNSESVCFKLTYPDVVLVDELLLLGPQRGVAEVLLCPQRVEAPRTQLSTKHGHTFLCVCAHTEGGRYPAACHA